MQASMLVWSCNKNYWTATCRWLPGFIQSEMETCTPWFHEHLAVVSWHWTKLLQGRASWQRHQGRVLLHLHGLDDAEPNCAAGFSVYDADLVQQPLAHLSEHLWCHQHPWRLLQVSSTWTCQPQAVASWPALADTAVRTLWRQTWDVADTAGNNNMETVVICCRYCRQHYADNLDLLQILQTTWKQL